MSMTLNWIQEKKKQWRTIAEIWGDNFIDICFLIWIIALICCLGCS